jgi:hypothetical protein
MAVTNAERHQLVIRAVAQQGKRLPQEPFAEPG